MEFKRLCFGLVLAISFLNVTNLHGMTEDELEISRINSELEKRFQLLQAKSKLAEKKLLEKAVEDSLHDLSARVTMADVTTKQSPYFRGGLIVTLANLCGKSFIANRGYRNRDFELNVVWAGALLGTVVSDKVYKQSNFSEFFAGATAGALVYVLPPIAEAHFAGAGAISGLVAGATLGAGAQVFNNSVNIEKWAEMGALSGACFGAGMGATAGVLMSTAIALPEVTDAVRDFRKSLKSEELK